MSKTETTPPPTSRPEMPDVIKFLLGEGKLDGFSFGEFPDNGEKYKRRYWWRKALREIWEGRAQPIDADAVRNQALEAAENAITSSIVESHSQLSRDVLAIRTLKSFKLKDE